MRKCFLNISLAKPRQKVEEVLKTHELFIYESIYYTPNSFLKYAMNIATRWPRLWIAFFFNFPVLYIFIEYDAYTNTQVKLYGLYLFILHSAHWIPCCPHADQIFQELPALHKRLCRSQLEYKDVLWIQENSGQFLDQLSDDRVLKDDCSPYRKRITVFDSQYPEQRHTTIRTSVAGH